MNRYSWHTTTEKDSGGWYKCTAIVVFPGNTVKFNTYPFYKLNLKGSHTHNHLKNMELRRMLSKKEIKALRKIMKRDKKKCNTAMWLARIAARSTEWATATCRIASIKYTASATPA